MLLERSWAPVLRAAAAAALGMGLAAVYLVPAAVGAALGRYSARRPTIPAQMIENSWLFARHADPALALHDAGAAQVSMIAVVMIAVALAGCW